MKIKPILAIVLLVLISIQPLAAPQAFAKKKNKKEQEGAKPPPYAEAIEVRIAEVEVFVTDKKGNFITGLSRDDFQLWEDKTPVEIKNFYAVEGGIRVKEESIIQLETGKTVEEKAEPGEPVRERLNLVIYVDNYNLRTFSRTRVFNELRKFLSEKMTSDDRVMVVTFDRGLKILQPFTNDVGQINSAIYDLETTTADRDFQDSERRDLLEEIYREDFTGLEDSTHLLYQVETYARLVYSDLMFTLGALKYFVGALAGIEGRKSVLYVSDGLPMVAAEEMFYALDDKYSKSGFAEGGSGVLNRSYSYDATEVFKDLTSYASINRVAFYTLDAGGLKTRSSFDVQYRDASMGSSVDSIGRMNLDASLKFMARETGGLAFTNSNDIEGALELVFADMDSYYSLGYTPIYAGENPYSKVKVKVKRKKVKVRHRTMLYRKTIGDKMADDLRAALIFEKVDNPMNIAMDFERPVSRKDKKDYLVPVTVAIPIGRLFQLPGEGVHLSQVRLFVASKNDQGWMSVVRHPPVPPPIEIPDDILEEAKQDFFYYRMKLAMHGGLQTIAVGVMDDNTSISSITTQTVNVSGD